MGFQKVEYEFPDDDKPKNDIEVEQSSAETIDLSGGKANKDSDIEIEVVDDTPKADRGRKASAPPEEVTEEELENYSDKVKNRIKHFTKGYHDERRAKEQALREREELERLTKSLVEENKKLQGTVGKNQTLMVEQAKKSVASEVEQAKREYKTAYDSGDSDAVLEAQDKLFTAKSKLEKLNAYKPKETKEEDTFDKPSQTVDTPTQTTPPVQADEKALEWANENSWFGSDDEMTSFALGYHNKLVKEGIDPKSDDYYAKLNSRMRSVFPDEFEDTQNEGLVDEKPKKASVVAPATRSTAPKKVKLTQTQVAIANRLGVPLELYAKKVAEEMRK